MRIIIICDSAVVVRHICGEVVEATRGAAERFTSLIFRGLGRGRCNREVTARLVVEGARMSDLDYQDFREQALRHYGFLGLQLIDGDGEPVLLVASPARVETLLDQPHHLSDLMVWQATECMDLQRAVACA